MISSDIGKFNALLFSSTLRITSLSIFLDLHRFRSFLLFVHFDINELFHILLENKTAKSGCSSINSDRAITNPGENNLMIRHLLIL